MADDKAKLLRSLAIDRGDGSGRTAPARRRRWPAWAAGGVAIAALLVAGIMFGPELRHVPPAAEQAAAPPPPQRAAAAEPRRSGGLAASGYVVARRKATIAAEITGKVVEVLVDE